MGLDERPAMTLLVDPVPPETATWSGRVLAELRVEGSDFKGQIAGRGC
jgi:hypothetical protein